MKNASFWLIKEMDLKMLTFVYWLPCLLLKNHSKLLFINGFMILHFSEIIAKIKTGIKEINLRYVEENSESDAEEEILEVKEEAIAEEK